MGIVRPCVPSETPETDSFGRTGDVVCGLGFQISGPLPISQFISDGGSGATALDFSRSNIAIPAQHRLRVGIRDSHGALFTSSSFSAISNSGRIRPASPAAVDAWLLNNSANAASIELVLEPFASSQVPGENVAIVEAEFNGAVMLTKGELWTNADCNAGIDPETGVPYVCNTGY